MISLILLIILLWSFYIGYSRGLVLQAYYTFSAILSLMIASGNYKSLAKILYLWVPFTTATDGSKNAFFASKYLFSLDEIFYAGLAFLVVYVLVYAIMRLIGIFVHLLNFINPDTRLTNGISGGLSVVVTLISLQLVLTVAATVPIATVQNYLQGSFVANAIIKYTPIMTSVLQQLWVTNVVG
ncbi:CvpA family protein [Streptococcus gallinaceus]|uniref:Membrane protein required for colicin V production n=1 Tax=Streptococcus gallinaceus TaxID=165758 RepID=A0ABV2JLQ6_9STRE